MRNITRSNYNKNKTKAKKNKTKSLIEQKEKKENQTLQKHGLQTIRTLHKEIKKIIKETCILYLNEDVTANSQSIVNEFWKAGRF